MSPTPYFLDLARELERLGPVEPGVETIRAAGRGNRDALGDLVVLSFPLIVFYLREHPEWRKGADPEDVLATAVADVRHAARTYDPDKGAWPTHLFAYVRRAAQGEGRRSASIRLPDWLWERLERGGRRARREVHQLQKTATRALCVARMGDWKALQIASTRETWPDSVVEAHDCREVVRNRIAKLPEPQRRVLELRYGIGSGTPLSLRETASRTRLTPIEVRMIESQALRALGAA